MRISYKKLWKLMIDKNIKKGKLQTAIGVSKGTMAKMGKNENVSLAVLLSICEYLQCDFGDIIEAIPEDKPSPYYLAYENRYLKVFAAGEACWGHLPNDEFSSVRCRDGLRIIILTASASSSMPAAKVQAALFCQSSDVYITALISHRLLWNMRR